MTSGTEVIWSGEKHLHTCTPKEASGVPGVPQKVPTPKTATQRPNFSNHFGIARAARIGRNRFGKSGLASSFCRYAGASQRPEDQPMDHNP